MTAPGVRIATVRALSARALGQASELLAAVGMRRRDLGKLARAIAASRAVVVARRGGALVGFGRLVGDGEYYAAIWDVAVAPDLQGKAIGSAIVERLLSLADREGLYMVALLTAAKNFPFYERVGFAVQGDLHAMTRLAERAHEAAEARDSGGGVQPFGHRRDGRSRRR